MVGVVVVCPRGGLSSDTFSMTTLFIRSHSKPVHICWYIYDSTADNPSLIGFKAKWKEGEWMEWLKKTLYPKDPQVLQANYLDYIQMFCLILVIIIIIFCNNMQNTTSEHCDISFPFRDDLILTENSQVSTSDMLLFCIWFFFSYFSKSILACSS